jgi:gliding motility-associated-like protein
VQKGGVYTVDLINEYGCVSSEKINVIEKCESSLFVPNAFTPNDDGRNEIFYVEGVNVYDFELWIFDRWGEVIYHSLDMKEGWNGKRNNNMQDAQIDVYVWKVKYRFWEDRENNKPLREEVGTVTLVE